MRKIILGTLGLMATLSVVPIVTTVTNKTITTIKNGVAQTSVVSTTNEAKDVKYELLPAKKHGIAVGNDRESWKTISWNDIEVGNEASFQTPAWITPEPNRFLIRTDGQNNNDRFIYQPIKVDITVPANTNDYAVTFKSDIYEWWSWRYNISGGKYRAGVQMFNLGDDANTHPDFFTNLWNYNGEIDSHSILEHGWNVITHTGSKSGAEGYSSREIKWNFKNTDNQPKTFTKYVAISYWIVGSNDRANGDLQADLKVGLRTNLDTQGVIERVDFKWGDINVECSLDNATNSCTLTRYVDGSGILSIPDHVWYAGRQYYVRKIPSNWSDGENDIRGIKFEENVSHLTEICDSAFEGTNALDNYILGDAKCGPLLTFPEGLERIGNRAFFGVDYGRNMMYGFSFPSTLKYIGENAFDHIPTLGLLNPDRTEKKSMLRREKKGRTDTFQETPAKLIFKSNPIIEKHAFGELSNWRTQTNEVTELCVPAQIADQVYTKLNRLYREHKNNLNVSYCEIIHI